VLYFHGETAFLRGQGNKIPILLFIHLFAEKCKKDMAFCWEKQAELAGKIGRVDKALPAC
jgi:hypothetical protein